MQSKSRLHPKLHYGNHLETLANVLAETLKEPLSNPLAQETIVVQSQGMAHWLSMQLAGSLGVCANVRFPFPNALVEELFRCVLSEVPDPPRCEPGIMTWKIMKVLPELVNVSGFEVLKDYLGEDMDGLKRVQLASLIADTFDQYLLFRPDMMLRWESGEETHWQAHLWRLLCGDGARDHRAALAGRFFKQLETTSGPPPGFPERISVFGISALPPFHLSVLMAAARWTDLNLFVLNPCREYWGEVMSEREAGRLSRRTAQPAEALHFEKGNSLLSSMGGLGRDFLDMLQEFHSEEHAWFKETGERFLLARIQADILNLQEGPAPSGALESRPGKKVPPDDDSIQVHACHGPLREMEVLKDVLLDLFEKDPGLAPSDVLVMAPDIEFYAPYIRAVFEHPADPSQRFPFTIADRGLRCEGRLAEPFLEVLGLAGGRFRASDVLSVLECPAVLAAFELEESEMVLIRRWIRESGIRWGIDGKSREDDGLPPFSENTWKAGMERLLLGYAMPGRGEHLFRGVLPYDELEGGEAAALGKLAEFLERLFNRVRGLGQPRPLEVWCADLAALLEDLFSPGPSEEEEMTRIRESLHRLSADAGQAGFQEDIDIRTVRWIISRSFGRQGFGYGFMSGGVTFCAMLPMRSIPFEVICLAGLNHDAYPRSNRPPGFDLMAARPKRGDRSRRNDDRYLFLETLISARQKLIMSYVGRSAQDNTVIPPSVLVMELLDYIAAHYETAGRRTPEDWITVHRLQAFHPDYFSREKPLFSYSAGHAEAAERIRLEKRPPPRFITGGLPLPADEAWCEIRLEDLQYFIANPARFLLQRRLGLTLDEAGAVLEDRERFELKGLERYLLRSRMVESRRAGGDPKGLFAPERAAGRLPHGNMGRAAFEVAEREAEDFWSRTAPFLEGGPRDPLDVALAAGDFVVSGRLAAVYRDALVHHRCALFKARDLLNLWIEHLVLNRLSEKGLTRRSLLAALEKPGGKPVGWVGLSYTPVDNAREVLTDILECYRLGLERPLPFFPESSLVFAEAMAKDPDAPSAALAKARRTWEGNDYSRGECLDAYFDLCFSGSDPLDSEFERIALKVYGPLLRHRERQR